MHDSGIPATIIPRTCCLVGGSLASGAFLPYQGGGNNNQQIKSRYESTTLLDREEQTNQKAITTTSPAQLEATNYRKPRKHRRKQLLADRGITSGRYLLSSHLCLTSNLPQATAGGARGGRSGKSSRHSRLFTNFIPIMAGRLSIEVPVQLGAGVSTFPTMGLAHTAAWR